MEQEKSRANREEERRKNITRLTEILLENGRVEDCLRAAKDENYQMQLIKELNIA